ncbi:unnamed protein product [Nesidiocoris tenuis]|uniref:Uncharacterized protein n=1 Tax=Nesidiocoris tenuis TaxID=355587 RepID=A0A6H5FUB2_9HEMI|nr:unnamed protein product [Nesidiocoris tenuis]
METIKRQSEVVILDYRQGRGKSWCSSHFLVGMALKMLIFDAEETELHYDFVTVEKKIPFRLHRFQDLHSPRLQSRVLFFLEMTPTELVTVLQEACKICQFANPSGCDLTIFGRCNETFVSRMLLTRAEFRAPAATRSAKGAQIDIDHQTMLHWTMRYLGCNSSSKSTRFWFQKLLIVMKRCLSSRKERKNLK